MGLAPPLDGWDNPRACGQARLRCGALPIEDWGGARLRAPTAMEFDSIRIGKVASHSRLVDVRRGVQVNDAGVADVKCRLGQMQSLGVFLLVWRLHLVRVREKAAWLFDPSLPRQRRMVINLVARFAVSYSKPVVLVDDVLELLVSDDVGVGSFDIEGVPRLEIWAL